MKVSDPPFLKTTTPPILLTRPFLWEKSEPPPSFCLFVCLFVFENFENSFLPLCKEEEGGLNYLLDFSS